MKNDRVAMPSKWYDYQELTNNVILRRGFTFNIIKGHVLEGYAVSTQKDCEVIIHPQDLNGRQDIMKVLKEYAQSFPNELANPDCNFGAWVNDEGYLYLDITIVVPEKSEALVLAKMNNQKAVFDLERRVVIAAGE